MNTGRPKSPLILSDEEKKQLESIVRSRSLPYGLITRARIILLAAQDISNRAIAEKVGLSVQSVCKWQKRYNQHGLSGLYDEIRPGRPRSISDEQVAEHPRDQVHYTPTYASWLNQVEIWFNVITQKAIRRGSFKSVKELTAKIDHFVKQYNADSRPFV
jgi:putative transposase